MINKTKQIHEDSENPEFIDVALNVTKISDKYEIDFNKLSSDLEGVSDGVEGTITKDGTVVMSIKHIDEDDLESILVDEYGVSPRDAHAYIYSDDKSVEECGDFRLEECGDDNPLEEGVKTQNPKKRTKGLGRKTINEKIDSDNLLICLTTIEIEYGKGTRDDVVDMIDRLPYKFVINEDDVYVDDSDEPIHVEIAAVRRARGTMLKDIVNGLEDCGIDPIDADRYVYDDDNLVDAFIKQSDIKLNESLKVPDQKLQAKVDKSEATLNDIIAKVKAENELDPATAKEASKKLKKEVENLKKYGVDPKKIANIKSTIVKLAKTDPSLKEILENGSTDLIIAKLMKNSRTLHDDIALNGKKISSISSVSLNEALKKICEEMKDTTSKLNESASLLDVKKIETLAKLRQSILEELDYRAYMKTKLNEDEDVNEDDRDENKKEDSEPKDEDVELSEVVFTLKNKKVADDFIEVCKDNGIPEDVLIVIDDEDEKNESATPSSDSRILNEEDEDKEDNKSEDESDSEKDENKEPSEEDEDKEVKIRLVDINYIDKVIEVLEDVYGITKKDFEEMIGGSIVNDDEDKEDSDKSDDSSDDKSDEDKDTDKEDTVSPEDIFKDL